MKLLGMTNIGGRVERDWLHTDDYGKPVITTETKQDVEPILEMAKAANADAPRRFGNAMMHHVAEIPFTVAEEACRIRGIAWRDFVQKSSPEALRLWDELINGRDFRALRVRPGRVEIRRT